MRHLGIAFLFAIQHLMPFFYCPESDFVGFDARLHTGTAQAAYPVSRLKDYYRPDLLWKNVVEGVRIDLDLDAASDVAAVALMDPGWTSVGNVRASIAGESFDPGVSRLDWRTQQIAVPDPALVNQASLRLVLPNNMDGRYDLSTIIVCRSWTELGTNPQNPIRRRRVLGEPEGYVTLEEDWTILVHTDAEIARWHKIRREWDQLYLWAEEGRTDNPRLLLAHLVRPPSEPLSIGGESEISCTWRSVPGRINT